MKRLTNEFGYLDDLADQAVSAWLDAFGVRIGETKPKEMGIKVSDMLKVQKAINYCEKLYQKIQQEEDEWITPEIRAKMLQEKFKK